MNQQDYLASHHKQQSILFKKGYAQQLVLSELNNKFYFPSLLQVKLYQEVIDKLQNKTDLKGTQMCWLVISQEGLGLSYIKTKAELRNTYGDKYAQIVESWFQTQENIQKPIIKSKNQLRDAFQMLNQKATKQDYYNIKEVPVFLISTKWLQMFYSDEDCEMQSIDNRDMLEPIQFIDTDPQYFHLNYAVSTDAKQNQHFKIVSYEAWKLIYQKFGGIEVKRFTTNQKKPVSEIWYKKILISILEQKCFHCINFQFLVPKFFSFKKIIERVKRLLIAYKCVPFQSLNKSISIIKVKDMTQQQMLEEIQNDDLTYTESSNFQIVSQQLDVQEAKIYSDRQMIIFNIHDKNSNNFFAKTKQLKSIILKQKCLNCGKADQNFQCICKSVHFCSQKCQKNHKQHSKQCMTIRKQQNQLIRLIKEYQITESQFSLSIDSIKKFGKIGFQNLGNTCYLNSALQCVLRVDDLCQYFTSNDYLKDINVSNVLGSEGHLACAFGQLVKQYYTSKKRRIQPCDVIKVIRKNPQFRGYNHQDSQQFFNYFLDKLHEDLNKIKTKPYLQDIQSNGRPDEIVSNESWINYQKRNKSFISSLFTGQYRSQIRCPDCDKISITFDPFMSVTLPFPRQQTTEQIKGYVLSPDGQYKKLQINVPSAMKTDQFFSKTFSTPVCGVYIIDKKVKYEWNQKKTVFSNIQNKGILLFYPKIDEYQYQLNLMILNDEGLHQAFQRRIFIKNQIQSNSQLLQILYKSIRKPIQKALKQRFETQQLYLQFCQQQQLIILDASTTLPQDKITVVKFKINSKIQFKDKIKFNFSSGQYDKQSQIYCRGQFDDVTIHSMLQSFKMPQKLTQQNMWYCNVCKDHKLADKIMALFRLPKYLVMHLKRFNHRGAKYRNRNFIVGEKIDTPVQLEQFEVINGKKYELIGVVNHFGSLTGGHYTAYVKKDDWFYYNDQSVKRAEVSGKSAYLVFYKAVQNQQSKVQKKQEK